ncbi:MAG: hypothetical protein J3Q66DRAFT_338108 [Benniella sp.]|nr:MAG: hypothetical protein J3Q66DRAFT_338108 [Benniella sp.]
MEMTVTTDSLKYLSLVSLGEIGRGSSLSRHAPLHKSILAKFNVHSEEVRSTAAYAIGNVSAGNVGFMCLSLFERRSQAAPRARSLRSLTS